ncbi:tetratricopeptide repeat protein [Micromonospora taraxaci]|uniref:tetratricopeptide repeat protein n=1 Tax=Micromonospora taraxaci TaxID=1316803 RepID=UPI0033F6D6AA
MPEDLDTYLGQVVSHDGLRLALVRLHVEAGRPSYRQLESWAARQRSLGNRELSLPKSTLSEVLAGKRAITKPMLNAFIRACGVSEPAQIQGWLQAWNRVALAGVKPTEPDHQEMSIRTGLDPARVEQVVAQLVRLMEISSDHRTGSSSTPIAGVLNVVESLKSIIQPERKELIPLLAKQGVCYLEAGSYNEAQRIFGTLHDLCKTEYGETSPEALNATYYLARTLRIRWRQEDALELLRGPTNALIESGEDRGIAMRFALELQEILSRLGQLDEALMICNAAIGKQAWKNPGGDYEYHLLYLALADLYVSKDDLEAARRTYDRFLYIAHNSNGMSPQTMLQGLQAYLPLLQRISSPAAAEVLQREIWDLEYKALAVELRSDLPGVLKLAGKIGIWTNLKDHGLRIAESALTVAREVFETEPGDLIAPLEALVQFHKNHANPAGALPLQEEIFDLTIAKYGRYSQESLYSAWDLQELLALTEDHEAAYLHGLVVLDIERLRQGVGEEDTIDTMIKVGKLALAAKHPHEALAQLTEAQNMMERNTGEPLHHTMADCKINMAITHASLGDSSASIAALVAASEICRTHMANSVMLTEDVAKVASDLGRKDLAQEFYEMAISVGSGQDVKQRLVEALRQLKESD